MAVSVKVLQDYVLVHLKVEEDLVLICGKVKMDKLLQSVYYNLSSPACYAGASAVLVEAKKRNSKVKKKDVIKFMEKQDVYTLHKPIKHKYAHNKTTAAHFDTHWQADLCDMQRIRNDNDNCGYIRTCMDIWSRYGFAVPIKTKKPEDVAEAFTKIIKTGRMCWYLATDAGKEFLGKPFQDFLKKHDIIHYVPKNDRVKCSVVERYNRTLKHRLWKYFSKHATHRWIDILPAIVAAINHSVNRTTGVAPADVTRENASDLIEKQYGKPDRVNFKFCIGDNVRISRAKHIFEKGYLPNFTEEIFTVAEQLYRKPPAYRLEDYNQEAIEGIFYEPELVRFVKSDSVYKIDQILKRRKKGKELFVSWKGYPASSNSWVKASDIVSTT